MSDLEQVERNADYNLGFDDGLAVGKSEAADRIHLLEAALLIVQFELTGLGHINGRTMRALNAARTALKETTDVD